MNNMIKIGFLGCGKIGKALLDAIKKNNYGEVVFIQDPIVEKEELVKDFPLVKVIRQAQEALYQEADLIIECATASALLENIQLILANCDLFMFSVTAFSEMAFEKSAKTLGEKYGKHIYIPHGAILGLDGILDGKDAWESISIETIKSPASLGRTEKEKTVLYEGPTREACKLFPRNVNVHAAVALAGIGFEKTQSKIIADPAVNTNTHLISIKGTGIEMQIKVSSFSESGVTGKYTPLSACGSLHRILDSLDVLKIV